MLSHLKTFAIHWYEDQAMTPAIRIAYRGVNHTAGIPVIIEVADAMPPRSAPMLVTLAITSSRHAGHSALRPYWTRSSAPRPRPLTMPRRAHMSCTDAISGKHTQAVQSAW